jgi:hypothetical protein
MMARIVKHINSMLCRLIEHLSRAIQRTIKNQNALPIDQDYLPQAVSCSLRPDVIEKAELCHHSGLANLIKIPLHKNPNT